jgi:O-succinylbenzoic acid--CoA ligase
VTSAGQHLLRPVTPDSVQSALADALNGGPPIAPLPDTSAERNNLLAALRFDEPVIEPDAAVVLGTSGSTGRPKAAVLSATAIRAAVSAAHDRLGGPGDWALATPSFYVAGLMVLARAITANTVVHPVGSDLSRLPDVVPEMRGRRYIAVVPAQLARALTQPRITEALAALDTVLVGGSSLDPSLCRQAEQSRLTVVVSYGMTETCGGCVYDGRPLDGVSIHLEPDTNRILIRSAMLFSGYRLRPDLTRAALRGNTLITQDRGEWTPGGQLRVRGRLDDEVITGGINVDLVELERACRCWPDLAGADLAVVAVPDAQWGSSIIAVTDGNGSIEDLRRFLSRTLPSYAVPRQLVHLDPLPRTGSGKIDRLELAARLRRHGFAGSLP